AILFASADGTLFLAERACQLVAERLDQIGHHRTRTRLDQTLDRHAGDEFHSAQARHLVLRHADAYRVVARTGLGILAAIRRDPGHRAVEFRRGALAEGHEPQDRGLPDS